MKFASLIGEVGQARATEEQIRSFRIEFARRNNMWDEIPETRLVKRERGWLVDTATDLVWRVKIGVVFPPGSAQALTPQIPLTFFVSSDNDVIFLERAGRNTWSEICERRERSERRA